MFIRERPIHNTVSVGCPAVNAGFHLRRLHGGKFPGGITCQNLDGVTPWPQDAKDRAVKVLGIPDEYIPRYFFIYQVDPGKPKYHIDPVDYIRIRDVYNNAADMRWAKQIADIYGCRPTNPIDFYTFIADVFCAGYLSAQLATAKAD
uniref:hypothetical protein n=1 Tax=Gemmiger formicilis TaxID=745368 RepID=UPI003FEDF64E